MYSWKSYIVYHLNCWCKFWISSIGALILDVGQLTVAGVSCETSIQPAHSQAISCSPTSRWSTTEYDLNCLSSKLLVQVLNFFYLHNFTNDMTLKKVNLLTSPLLKNNADSWCFFHSFPHFPCSCVFFIDDGKLGGNPLFWVVFFSLVYENFDYFDWMCEFFFFWL